MNGTQLTISNEKNRLRLPPEAALYPSGTTGTSYPVFYYSDLDKMGLGTFPDLFPSGTTTPHVHFVQGFGQTKPGVAGNPTRPYATISAAIAAAAAGDTIVIYPGGTAVDYLGRPAYSEGVNIDKDLTIIFEGAVASGYWVFGTYPGATYAIKSQVKNGVWTNGLAVIGSNGQQCRYYFDNCSFEDKTSIYQLVPSGFEQTNLAPGLDKQYYTNCRFRNTTTGGLGVFRMQGRDDASPTQHVDIILQDCQVEGLNVPIATGFASVYHRIHLRGSTALLVNAGQALQTVTRANSGVIIPDAEIFIDERTVGVTSGNTGTSGGTVSPLNVSYKAVEFGDGTNTPYTQDLDITWNPSHVPVAVYVKEVRPDGTFWTRPLTPEDDSSGSYGGGSYGGGSYGGDPNYELNASKTVLTIHPSAALYQNETVVVVYLTGGGGASGGSSVTIEQDLNSNSPDTVPSVAAVNAALEILGTSTTQTADYTLQLTDAGNMVPFKAAANCLVPLNSVVAFPVGSVLEIAQEGTGQVTIVAADPAVTLRYFGGLKTAGQWASVGLRQRSVDEWVITGGVA